MHERTVIHSLPLMAQVLSTTEKISVCEAAGAMTRANQGGILVLDGMGALVGILTERDLMTRVVSKALDPEKTKVFEVMTRNPYCIPPEMKVSDAVLIMLEHGFRHLPILSPSAKILGVFSMRDALPREINNAKTLAEFHEQVNDALG
ncbi:MAG: CBS domain-containing protein [Burkholderiaceae bacterium]